MTNEERQAAIEWLKGRPITMPGAKKMYALAIEALEMYVPDTNVGDMISRRAATTIPVMPKEHRHYQTNNLDDAYEQGWNDLQECIENLPQAQPTIIHCENCEHWDTSWETVYGLHYCPMIDMATKKNFFCKYGTEKRGGEADETD